VHGEVLEHAPALHHQRDPALHALGRAEPGDLGAVEPDRAARDRAALAGQQARDRLERGRLAGAVRAEQRDDLARGDRERQAAQHEERPVVDDVDAGELEHYFFGTTAAATSTILPPSTL
jgi:hypothetical protein